MALIGPILDDRSYEDLKQELLRRIPVYTPEWTDYNESDPGVVLLELFAYLGESLLFRFNQIPDATSIAFLRLLGGAPRPAQLAHALLTLSTDRLEGVHVRKATEAKAGSVVFQTEDEVHAWPLEVQAFGKVDAGAVDATTPAGRAEQRRRDNAVARLPPAERQRAVNAKLVHYDVHTVPLDPTAAGAVPVDVSTTVDQALWVALLTRTPQLRRDLPSELENGIVYVGVALDEQVLPQPFDLARRTGSVTPLPADSLTADPPGILWELWNGPAPGPGVPSMVALDVVGDSTRAFSAGGVVKLTLPATLPQFDPTIVGDGSWSNPPPIADPKVAARVVAWLRARRPVGEADAIHGVRWVGINAVSLVQARTATPELLGTGTGNPDQTFRLTQPSVVAGSVQLEVEEVDGWHRWTEVENFASSEPLDKHFQVDLVGGLVTFGARCRIPQIGQRIRVVSYQYGGGSAGNVPEGAIKALTDVAGVKATNVLRAAGGADAASLADALELVPADVHRRDRAVTEADFTAFALEVPGVHRAETIPLLHPDTLNQRAAGVISVVVFPTEDLRNPGAPAPDISLLRRVAAYLDPRRLVTNELYVIPPTYRRIAISVGVHVRDGYQVDAVRRWVELILRQYLAPVPPYGPDGSGWPLGRAIRRAELEAVAVQVDGVEYLEDSLQLAVYTEKDGWTPVQGALPLQKWEVPELAGITVVRGPALPVGEAYPAPVGDTGGGPPPVVVPQQPDVC